MSTATTVMTWDRLVTETQRFAAERLEQEARAWASSRLPDAHLQRYRDHIAELLVERSHLVERELLGVLDRAIEIRRTR